MADNPGISGGTTGGNTATDPDDTSGTEKPTVASTDDGDDPDPSLNMFEDIDEYTDSLRTKLNMSALQLSSKKDRAQASSSSALSVSTVVILKTVVDAGPDGIEYYSFNMFLVVCCITLQIVIGALLLVMHRVYKSENEPKDALSMLPDAPTMNKCIVTPGAPAPALPPDDAGETEPLVESESVCCSCCSPCVPCTCCRDDDDDDDDMTMEETVDQQLAQLTAKFMKQLLATVHAQDDLAATDPTDRKAVEKAQKEVQRNLNILETILKEIKTTTTLQGLIWERKRLAKLQRYQTIIEFLLYATFIINAFLVGFGTVKSA